MSELTEWLKNDVYPSIDAVDCGWMDHLKPSGISNGYTVNCPECGAIQRAYYYSYSAGIKCNRLNECGKFTSVFDILLNEIGSKREVIKTLEAQSQVPAPGSDSEIVKTITSIVQRTLIRAAKTTEQGQAAVKTFCQSRNLTLERFEARGYGFYPSAAYLRKAIESEGGSIEEAISLGFLPEQGKKSGMEGRVIGFWAQKGGECRLWGRLVGSSARGEKYLFSEGMKKTIPYRFKPSTRTVIAVEGTLDADSLRDVGYNGVGIGQAGINEQQATFFAMSGTERVIHLTDSDKAGIEGALRSIESCSQFEIEISISVLGEGLDDVDKLRATGREDLITTLVEKSVLGGVFLANLYASSLVNPNLFYFKEKIFKIIKSYSGSGSTYDHFTARMAELGYKTSIKAQSTKLFSELIAKNIDPTIATEIVKKRFGILINLL